jgi:integrase
LSHRPVRRADRPAYSFADASTGAHAAGATLGRPGLRWSELAGLRVGAVDLAKLRINVREVAVEVNGARIVYGATKSGEARSVPIPRFLADELRPLVEGRSSDALVFAAGRGGPLRNRASRRGWFAAAAEAIGQPDLTPHELRHTAASLTVSARANVLTVAPMFGHSHPSVTIRINADLFGSDLDAVGERLDALRRVPPVFPEPKSKGSGGSRSSGLKSRKR